MTRGILFIASFAPLWLAGCIHVSMDPIKVHAVVDVNVKVDRALTDFFGDLDQKSTVITAPSKP